MHRIDGPGATVDNKFTEGDPVGGIQATVVTDDFLNDVQEELVSVLAAAGVTPAKGTQDQVLQAIYKLAQSQKATAFATNGSSTVLTLNPTPGISAYSANQRFSVKFHVGSGVNPTLNVSGKGPKALKQYDGSGAKVAAVFFADQISDIVYDGTDFIMLDSGSGIPSATTATPGIARFGTSSEQIAGLLENVMANPLGVMALINAFFPKRTFSTNDFIRIPNVPGGLIIQFGVVAVPAYSDGTSFSGTWPTPFPTACFGVVLTSIGAVNILRQGAVTLSGFTAGTATRDQAGSSALSSAFFISIGF
ncbi:gp53-like domain-containing protein [Pseudomonas grimontii]|uniref:gp53-like domain-containing protein n=1 Tax=Pseudomonas grimontii TaxID=129847 RepID=UPI00387B323B